jgi:hypothetical protein
MDKYLPIGTVVILKKATKRLMITGFCAVTEKEPNKTYDYCGCLYPEGIIASDENFIFNHEQIDKVYFLGFSDDNEKKFKEAMKATIDRISN